MTSVLLAVLFAADFSIRDYGADAEATPKANAAAIQKAIEAAATAGGGRVVVPSGMFVTGTIYLRSNVELNLATIESRLRGSPDLADYNHDDAYPGNSGGGSEGWSAKHLVIAYDVANVAITGPGVIDGNGGAFFKGQPYFGRSNVGWRHGYRNSANKKDNYRPGQEIVFVKCRDVRMKDVLLQDMSCWSCFFYDCERVRVKDCFVRSQFSYANTDGFDVDRCRDVVIEGCDIETGDDCLTVRASGRTSDRVSEDIVFSNCICRCSASGVRLGVGTGEIRNVLIRDLDIREAGRGIVVQSAYPTSSAESKKKGVTMHDVVFEHIRMRETGQAVVITSGSPDTAATIRDLVFRDVKAETMGAFIIDGCAKEPISNLVFDGLDLEIRARPFPYHRDWQVIGTNCDHEAAIQIDHAKNVRFDRTSVRFAHDRGDTRSTRFSIVNSENVTVNSVVSAAPAALGSGAEEIRAMMLKLGSNTHAEPLDPAKKPANQWDWEHTLSDELRLDEDVWREVTDSMAAKGYNMVVIGLAEGVVYPSHPELAVKGSWSVEKLKAELKRLRGMGLEPIPKLNFAASHDTWLGEYHRMVSTKKYYEVCEDLIRDVIEIFDHPRFLHLGYDEEMPVSQAKSAYMVVRQGELWWHDLDFFCRTVEKYGTRPWIWADYVWHHREEFLKRMPKSVLLSNWYYRTNFGETICDRSQMEKKIMAAVWPESVAGPSAYLDLEAAGYDQLPCGSVWANDDCMAATVRFCRERISKDRLKGFLMAAWLATLKSNREQLLSAVETGALAFRPDPEEPKFVWVENGRCNFPIVATADGPTQQAAKYLADRVEELTGVRPEVKSEWFGRAVRLDTSSNPRGETFTVVRKYGSVCMSGAAYRAAYDFCEKVLGVKKTARLVLDFNSLQGTAK